LGNFNFKRKRPNKKNKKDAKVNQQRRGNHADFMEAKAL
jgi:hypothetical protein